MCDACDISAGQPGCKHEHCATNYTAVVNETFTVDIELSGPDPVRGASAYIDFDNTYLEVQSITPGTALDTVLENDYEAA